MPSAEIPLFAYDFLNPKGTNSIEVDLHESKGTFYFDDTGKGGDTVITLKIPDTEVFGFIYLELAEETRRILQDIVTAMNLNLERSGLTREINLLDRAEVNYTEEELEKIDRTYADVGLGIEASMDEEDVLNTFSELRKFDRYSYNTKDLKKINLIKALKLYDNSIDNFDRYTQHMSLYMALEHVALYDGSEKYGEELDKEMNKITGIKKKHFSRIRKLYNRQKHPDRNQGDMNKSRQVLKEMELHTRSLRSCLNEALKARINNLI